MPETTRKDHLTWCKRRALEYLDVGKLGEAVTSMLSDLNKHDETRPKNGESPMVALAMLYAINNDVDGLRRWITGFN